MLSPSLARAYRSSRSTGRVSRGQRSDGEEVARARVARRVAQLRHRPCLDLADPLTGEVEVLAHLFEGAGLAAVEAEAQLQDLALALVERSEQASDLFGQQRGRRNL